MYCVSADYLGRAASIVHSVGSCISQEHIWHCGVGAHQPHYTAILLIKMHLCMDGQIIPFGTAFVV